MLPSFNETKYNSHWQLCSLEELGRGKSKHRQGMITDYFWENIPLFRLGTSKLQIFGLVLTELPERESPLLQMWDESEVKSSVSSNTLMI